MKERVIFGIYNSGGSIRFVSLYPSDMDADGVYRTTFTGKVGTSANTYARVYHMPLSTVTDSTVEWIQIENKDHATPFTPDTREGVVRDISGYGNDATLVLATTPKWTNDSKIGSGAYEFSGNGTKDGVIAGDNIPVNENITSTDNYTDGCTYSFWINVNPNAENRMSLLFGDPTVNHIEIYSQSKYFRTEARLQNGYSFGSGSFPDEVRGVWSHFSIVFENNKPNRPVKWYQNGKLFYTGSLDGGSNSGTEYFSFNSIGRSTGTTSYQYAPSFNGKIDDFRIYATTLSEEDVKELYQTRASLDDKGNLYVSGINESRTQQIGNPTPSGAANQYQNLLYINVKNDIYLISTTIYSYFTGYMTVQLVDSSTSQVARNTEVYVVNGQQDIYLNWEISAGDYYINRIDPENTPLMRSAVDPNMPYEDNNIIISSSNNYYYFWFNLKYKLHRLDILNSGIINTTNISELGSTDGLIAYYPFDGNPDDYSGNGLDGTPTGSPVIASGIKDTAYKFDGTNFITVPHNNILNPASMTITGWIRFDANTAWMLVSKGVGAGGYYIYGSSASACIFSIFADDGTRYNASIGALSVGDWYFLCGTIDTATGDMKAYKNGELITTTTNASKGTVNTTNLFVGCHTSGYRTNGALDEVRIYNRALSGEEIKILYDITRPPGDQMILTNNNVYIRTEIKET